ncbi:MAG: WXG100 family type VII secretion target [Micrococcales bacterium]|nr:WXG100 family type VII secretion target [Micrococcales bacterium]
MAMGIGSFSVQTGRVRGLSTEIQSNANAIRQALTELEDQVKTLISQWEGSAQEAYHRSQREWTEGFTALQQLLVRVSAKTQEMADGYDRQDSQSAGRF